MATTDKKPFEYQKQPSEKEIIGVDFSRRCPAGTTISSYTVISTIYNTSLAQQSVDNLVISNISLVGKTLYCMISGGTADGKYRVTFDVTLSDGQIKEADVFVTVIES